MLTSVVISTGARTETGPDQPRPLVWVDICNGVTPVEISDYREFLAGQFLGLLAAIVLAVLLFAVTLPG